MEPVPTEMRTHASGVRLRGNRVLVSNSARPSTASDNDSVLGDVDDLKPLSSDSRTDQRPRVMLRADGRFDNRYLRAVRLQGGFGLIMETMEKKEDDAVFSKMTWYRQKDDEWVTIYTNRKSNTCIAVDLETKQITLVKPPAREPPEGADARVFVEKQMGAARLHLCPTVCPNKYLAYDGELVLLRNDPCWWEEAPATDSFLFAAASAAGNLVTSQPAPSHRTGGVFRTMWRKMRRTWTRNRREAVTS